MEFLLLLFAFFILLLYFSSSSSESGQVKIVAKRVEISGNKDSTNTVYYVTFQYTDSARKEFRVSGKEYGMLAVGDVGRVTVQGNVYKSFERVTEEKT